MESLLNADIALRAWLVAHSYPPLDAVMVFLSAIGRVGAVWIVLAALLAWRRPLRRPAAFRAVLAVLLTWGLTDAIIKPLVGRPRPFVKLHDVRLIDYPSTTASFPSGHASTAAAGALVLSAAWPEARAALWVLAALISYSRIWVGAHYPLDVLAGVVFGVACGWLVVGGRLGWRLTRPA